MTTSLPEPRLEALAPNVWVSEHDLFMGPVHFRGRMTVVKLEDGGLMLHSPNPITDALHQQLAELGPVHHLVAPNLYHHLHVAGVSDRYPKATVWGAPGLDAKRPDLKFKCTLGTHDFLPEFDHAVLRGAPKLAEAVFLHRASRSLIVTDLVMNIHEYQGLITGLVLRIMGIHRRFGQSRMFRTIIKDRQAAAEFAETILSWNFDRVVMAHGRIIERDAKSRLASALHGMRQGNTARQANAA